MRLFVPQSRQATEIIVVDDGSSDDSAAIAESFGSPVRVIWQENRGECGARNRGVEEAQGDWIAFLDADDLWHPEKLAEQMKLAESRPDAKVIYCAYCVFHGDESSWSWESPVFDPSPSVVDLTHTCPINMITGMARREVIGETRFPLGVRNGGDMVFWLGMRTKCEFHFVPKVLTASRQHAAQVTASHLGVLRSVRARREWITQNLEQFNTEDYEAVGRLLEENLQTAMHLAYWARDLAACRAIADDLYAANPALCQGDSIYRWRWLPTWLLRVKDLASGGSVGKTSVCDFIPPRFTREGGFRCQ